MELPGNDNTLLLDESSGALKPELEEYRKLGEGHGYRRALRDALEDIENACWHGDPGDIKGKLTAEIKARLDKA